MQASSRLFASVLAAFALGLAGRGVAQTQLAKDSPFKPVGGTSAAVAESSETIEFSGVVMGNKTLVILYDKLAKKGRLIPVGETVDGITVMAYDSHREQVAVKIGTEQKTLQLRKSTGVANAGTSASVAPNPAMNFNVPTPQSVVVDFGQKIQPSPASDSTAAPLTAPKPEGPVTPPTIAKQEEEARMLVSDLLEIGMAQRKEYEEKQKRAAAGEQNTASTPPPAPAQPAKGS